MKSFFATLAVLATLAPAALAQFTINTPLSVVVCLPTLLSWTGGTGPYFLSILPANQPSAAALVDLGQQDGSSVTWLANLGVGTSAFLNLRDSTGTLAQSGTFTVQSGSNTSCVGQAPSTSGGAAATTSAPATTTGGASVTSGGSSSAAHTTASGSGTAASTKPSSGAVSKFAGAGAAALVGSALLSIVV